MKYFALTKKSDDPWSYRAIVRAKNKIEAARILKDDWEGDYKDTYYSIYWNQVQEVCERNAKFYYWIVCGHILTEKLPCLTDDEVDEICEELRALRKITLKL